MTWIVNLATVRTSSGVATLSPRAFTDFSCLRSYILIPISSTCIRGETFFKSFCRRKIQTAFFPNLP